MLAHLKGLLERDGNIGIGNLLDGSFKMYNLSGGVDVVWSDIRLAEAHFRHAKIRVEHPPY